MARDSSAATAPIGATPASTKNTMSAVLMTPESRRPCAGRAEPLGSGMEGPLGGGERNLSHTTDREWVGTLGLPWGGSQASVAEFRSLDREGHLHDVCRIGRPPGATGRRSSQCARARWG